jgi:general secretion pathway protein K
MVLWLLVLLEVLVASLAITARGEGELVRNRVNGLIARSYAEAALFLTIDRLAREEGEDERTLRTDGSVQSMDYTNINVSVSVLDEAGKIDLNAARPELLRSLIAPLAGSAERGMQVTDAILDWRDVDHQRREYGAEDEQYQELGKAYGAKDEYFDELEELLLIKGMDDDLYAKLTSAVTIYTGAEGINPAVAQREVLRAIPGIEPQQVDEYLDARDRHYSQGEPMPVFPIQDQKYISPNRDQLYSIHIAAAMQDGTTERIAVLTRVSAQRAVNGEKPYEFIRWDANDRSTVLLVQ